MDVLKGPASVKLNTNDVPGRTYLGTKAIITKGLRLTRPPVVPENNRKDFILHGSDSSLSLHWVGRLTTLQVRYGALSAQLFQLVCA
jgi:hypothetical protein